MTGESKRGATGKRAGIRQISSADNSHYPLNRSVFVSTFCLDSVHKALNIRRIMILKGSR